MSRNLESGKHPSDLCVPVGALPLAGYGIRLHGHTPNLSRYRPLRVGLLAAANVDRKAPTFCILTKVLKRKTRVHSKISALTIVSDLLIPVQEVLDVFVLERLGFLLTGC